MFADPRLQPALDVIRKTDPALYVRMDNSPWKVHAIVTGDEPSVAEYAGKKGDLQALMMLLNLESAFGVTISSPDQIPMWLTFINVPSTVGKARKMRVP